MSKVNGPIQLKRGSGDTLSDNQKGTVLLEGEPFYHKGAEFLTIGDGDTSIENLPKIGVGEIISISSKNDVTKVNIGHGGKIDVEAGGNISVASDSVVNVNGSVELGQDSSLNGSYAIAIGKGARANGGVSLAIGWAADAGGSSSTSESVVIGPNASAIGGQRTVTGGSVAADNQVVIGANSVGQHRDTVAIGHGANAWNDSCIALGMNASARGYLSVAIGVNAASNSPLSIALGQNSTVQGWESVAIGEGAKSYLNDCISIGTGAVAGNNEVATLSKFSSIAIGSCSNAAAEKAISIGDNAKARSEGSIAIGGDASTSTNEAIAIGDNAVSSDSFLINIGSSRGSRMRVGPNTVLLGHNTGISVDIPINSVAIGTGATVTDANFVQFLSNLVSDPTLKVGTKYASLVDSLTSDARLKQNVTDADTSICLADVNRLKVSRFEYKPFVEGIVDKHRTGWMADDVEKVFKNAVYRRDDTFPELDENGEKVYEEIELEDGTKQKVEKRFVIKDVQHLDMTTIGLPTLWGAVQELSKLMTATQERITELENAVKALKKENTLLKKQVKALEDSQKLEPEIEA